jgi:ferric-chelate reductase
MSPNFSRAQTTGFWVGPEAEFWTIRTNALHWADAKVRLVVTGIIGHHIDSKCCLNENTFGGCVLTFLPNIIVILGLLLIPVSRNSILGRAFQLHQGVLLYAHKLLAYVFLIGVVAHGAAYYVRLTRTRLCHITDALLVFRRYLWRSCRHKSSKGRF